MKKLQYNSPVILSFFLLSLLSLGLGALTDGRSTLLLFSVYRAPLSDLLFYPRLLLHVLGHANWQHFFGNMLLLLVVGPPLEERYGSVPLLLGILATALLTGLLQCLLFPTSALLGASGVVFFLIMLSSFAGMRDGRIPVTLLLVGLLYLGQEVYNALFIQDNVANFMHLAGGALGAGYGFWLRKRNRG